MGSAVRDILSAFHGVKRTGKGWMAKCPAHDDRTASLSISHGDVQPWVLNCLAGCAPDAILAAAHLEPADVCKPRQTKTAATIAATYDYRDAGGLLLYQQVRMEPKDFRSRRPDGKGWIWSLGNVARVLYRLPELQGKTTTAYVVEGEKDADRLWSIKLCATTNAGGAGKWRPEYAQQLVAATVECVVVLPDNDDPGRAHAEAVASSCHAAGLAVKVVALPGLPPKGDVSDWLDDTRTKDELIGLVKATPLYAPPSAEDTAVPRTGGRRLRLTPASAVTPRPVRWLWNERLALGTLSLLGGREGIGKSIVECTLAADITRGRLPGICAGTPRAVIIAATEDSWAHTIVPRLIGADADEVPRVCRRAISVS